MAGQQILLDADDMDRTLHRMVEELAALLPEPSQAVLVGIRTHGVTLARHLRRLLALHYEWDVPMGILDVTLYRDDFGGEPRMPGVTELDFDVTGRTVVLVDDVLFTGRTVRCALDALMDFGRPRAVRLACLIDRGLRELPIQADVLGLRVEARPEEKIDVRLSEQGPGGEVWIVPDAGS